MIASISARVSADWQQFDILVLAVPDQYHADIIPVALESFRKLAAQHQFGMSFETDAKVLEGDLTKYDALVFLNTNPASLTEPQRENFKNYIQPGKGLVPLHWSMGYEKDWPWYARLVGRSFVIHPIMQSAVVNVVDRDFPATMAMPERFVWSDEWYVTTPVPGVETHTLLNLDESTYDPAWIWPGQECKGMGADHPVAWSHTFEGTRVFVTTLGHVPEMFNDRLLLDHIYGGIYWAATGRGIPDAKAE